MRLNRGQISVAELAVIGVSTAHQIEIDAAAAALRGAKLGQSPISRLVIGVVIGPRGRGGEPASFSETARQQGVAHQPTAIDADAVAGSRQSGVDLAEDRKSTRLNSSHLVSSY